MGSIGALGAWLLLAIVIVIAVLIAVSSVFLGNRMLSQTGPEHNSTLSPFITVVGLVYGALLGFTVVVAWEQFHSAEANASHEASTLTTMYRQTVAMPQPQQSQLRGLLRKYADAVEGPEWNTQDIGGASDAARAAITEMYRVVGSEQSSVASSAIGHEFLGQLTVLASDRNTRFLDAEPRIPPLLWSALIFGAVVLITLTGFLRLHSNRGHMILSSAVAVLLGLLLYLVFVLDHPFGELGVTSKPFGQAVKVFDAIDSGK
jgi:purine-cytosine permease-like protein